MESTKKIQHKKKQRRITRAKKFGYVSCNLGVPHKPNIDHRTLKEYRVISVVKRLVHRLVNHQ